MAEPAVQKTHRLPLELAQWLEEESQRTKISQADIVIAALEMYRLSKK